MNSDLKTVAALGLLTAALPVNLVVTGAALVRRRVVGRRSAVAQNPQTILISGGKMTKALQLARSFSRAGHRVVLVEQGKYWLSGHRFSSDVDRFYTVPRPQDEGYVDALLAIVEAEQVDIYLPVCSPVASYYDALAKGALSKVCAVLHLEPDVVHDLDDKEAFSRLAGSLGLPTPDSHRITDPQEVVDFDFAASDRTYVLKSIGYDPVRRLDLTRLPRSTPQETAAFVRALPISVDNPWILQEFIEGAEFCTHSTVRDGHVQVWCCCASSAFQINYEMVEKPAIEAWVSAFVGALDLTGEVSFDFIEAPDGRVFAIECNPRTHSAITMFYDHPGVARAYLERNVETVIPLSSSRPTYWLYHELWRALTDPRHAAQQWEVVRRGKDAIFDLDDPLPFLMLHHAQVPWLLLQNMRQRKDWLKIDFNIGKLVEAAGD